MLNKDAICTNCRLYTKTAAENFNLPPVTKRWNSTRKTFDVIENNTRGIDVYVVGEHPSMFDTSGNEQGGASNFGDTSGRNVLHTLRVNGANYIRCYNVLNCFPVGAIDNKTLTTKKKKNEDEDAPTTTKAVKLCSAKLLADLHENPPVKSILILGELGLRLLFPNLPALAYQAKMANIRGTTLYYEIDGRKIPCIISYAHAFAFAKHDFGKQRVAKDDYKKAALAHKYKIKPAPVVSELINVNSKEKAQELFTLLKKPDCIIAFDFETIGLKPYHFNTKSEKNKIISIAFCFKGGITYAVPLNSFLPNTLENNIRESLARWFASDIDGQYRVAHNVKFDLTWAIEELCRPVFGDDIFNTMPYHRYHDTMLIAWMLVGGRVSLKILAPRVLRVDEDWAIDVSDLSSQPIHKILHYNALDTFYTYEIFTRLYSNLWKDQKFKTLYDEILLPATWAFLKIECRGISIDEDIVNEMKDEMSAKSGEILADIRDVLGDETANPNSTKQLINYFVNTMEYPVKSYTKIGKNPQMNEETLTMYAEDYGDKVAKKVIDYKSLIKTVSTNLVGYMSNADIDDKRIRSSFKLAGTVTGRTSSSEPNLQNVPKRGAAKIVRKVFKPKPGYIYSTNDYGQIEARLFAVVSGDANFVDAITKDDYDIHAVWAKKMYGENISGDELKKKRQIVKSGFVFPTFYGAGSYSVGNSLGLDEEYVKKMQDDLFKQFPDVLKWQKNLAEFEKANRYVRSIFGRRRASPMTMNEMLNAPIQSAANDVLLSTLIKIADKFQVGMTIHDDITIILPEDDKTEEQIKLVAECMAILPWKYLHHFGVLEDIKAWVPLSIESGVGKDWYSIEDIYQTNSVELGCNNWDDCVKRGEELEYILKQMPTIPVYGNIG